MKADIIRIGNSHGIRIPKPILEQCGLKGCVEMKVKDCVLMIAPARKTRDGWSDAFRVMAEKGDDAPLLDEDDFSDWDVTEWHW